ncbi:MAG: hypothetical protein V4546_12060 [Bacteroidota bacterium]
MQNSIFNTGGNSQNTSTISLTAENFFIENNPDGYMAKSELVALGRSLTRREPKDFIGFFEQLRRGGKFDANFTIQKDRGGKEYGYPRFFMARGVKGYKVILNEGMKRFIDDYVEGVISVEFTAMDLEKIALTS